MKKTLALLTALMMLALAPLSLAETVKLTENASGFDITVDLPAGATVSVQTNDDVPYTFVSFADETMPELYISVAPTEEYEEQTLADLSDDELDTLFAMLSADLDDPSYTMVTTAGGYECMVVEDNSATDSAIIALLYDGYFIQISVWNVNYDTLTDDDMTVAETMIDSLKIVEI
ncbi:MAG: hypothetical protein GX418_00915 [Clostridiales bacterium]|nr:hypothetical protein [Clostridiales bacterium]